MGKQWKYYGNVVVKTNVKNIYGWLLTMSKMALD
jgi:hypothetical protein